MKKSLVLLLRVVGFSLASTIPNKDDYKDTGLERVVPDFALYEGDSYAGYLPTKANFQDISKSALHFWFFEPHAPIDQTSMVVWLNGGPGCSSFAAGKLLLRRNTITMKTRNRL